MKQENEFEREILKKEERMAKSFKFTKMSKKVAFLPSLHQKGVLEDGTQKFLEKDNKFMDHREREALIFPNKIKEREKKFGLVSTQNLGSLGKMVGQETDTYDDVMLWYMRKQERGLVKPMKNSDGQTIKPAASTAKWTPNNFSPDHLQLVKPLLDRSNTPRGALRSITLDRNFSKEKWLYNKNTLDKFDPNASKKEIERNKNLKRITRK